MFFLASSRSGNSVFVSGAGTVIFAVSRLINAFTAVCDGAGGVILATVSAGF